MKSNIACFISATEEFSKKNMGIILEAEFQL